jgi:hypothetical protein
LDSPVSRSYDRGAKNSSFLAAWVDLRVLDPEDPGEGDISGLNRAKVRVILVSLFLLMAISSDLVADD